MVPVATPVRIAIVTDAWTPQINGVVNTLAATAQCLREAGLQVRIVEPGGLKTFSLPGYPEVRLACRPYAKVAIALDSFEPDCIHIATEGPMGLAARRYCVEHGLQFTTSFHTRFPEYLRARSGVPTALTYQWLRWFHGRSRSVMVPTPAMRRVLEARGFARIALWGRGVDTGDFKPEPQPRLGTRPVFLYVGRLAAEKNVEAFLQADLPGIKWLIGDGPAREALERRYPQALFLGARRHEELAPYYNSADVFVFPSRTDTFGLVMAEAMACGVPVAAYPVEGPIDVVAHGRSGVLDEDLAAACRRALLLDREAVRTHALRYSWTNATAQFVQNLQPARGGRLPAMRPLAGA